MALHHNDLRSHEMLSLWRTSILKNEVLTLHSESEPPFEWKEVGWSITKSERSLENFTIPTCKGWNNNNKRSRSL